MTRGDRVRNTKNPPHSDGDAWIDPSVWPAAVTVILLSPTVTESVILRLSGNLGKNEPRIKQIVQQNQTS